MGEEKDDEVTQDGSGTEEGNSTEKEEETPKKKKKIIQVEKEKKKVHKQSLKVESYYEGRVQPYSAEIMTESKAKMDELARKDKERQMLEETRNKVESYIYKIKNTLVDDEENIGKVTTEAQREEVTKLSSDAEEWLYEDGYNADLATMMDKYAEISEPMEKILYRLSEMTARPAALNALKEKLDKIEKLMTKWETTHPHITEEERTNVLSKVETVKEWMAQKEEEQSKIAGSDDPTFTSEECPEQTKSIEAMISRLSRKPKPEKKQSNETKGDSNETKAENQTIKSEEETQKTDEENSSSQNAAGEEADNQDGSAEESKEKSEDETKEDSGDETKDEPPSDEL